MSAGDSLSHRLQPCVDAVLIEGLDDWVQAAEVASVAQTIGMANSKDAVQRLSLKVIGYLLENGLAEAGSVSEREGFTSWNLPAHSALARIESEWTNRATGPGLGEICWLNLTSKGIAAAGASPNTTRLDG